MGSCQLPVYQCSLSGGVDLLLSPDVGHGSPNIAKRLLNA